MYQGELGKEKKAYHPFVTVCHATLHSKEYNFTSNMTSLKKKLKREILFQCLITCPLAH